MASRDEAGLWQAACQPWYIYTTVRNGREPYSQSLSKAQALIVCRECICLAYCISAFVPITQHQVEGSDGSAHSVVVERVVRIDQGNAAGRLGQSVPCIACDAIDTNTSTHKVHQALSATVPGLVDMQGHATRQ